MQSQDMKPIIELVGETLLDVSGKDIKTEEALLGKDAIGLYFSAHWCPPCRMFTPVLGEKYKALKKAGKKVEIVFVSSDSNEQAFDDYSKEQPWISLPYSDRDKKAELSNKFKVSGIPTLVFVDGKTGETITTSGRAGVSSKTFIEDFPYNPKPLYDLSENLDGIDSEPSLVVLMEAADQKDQTDLRETLYNIAEKEKAKKETDQRVSHFFTAAGGGPTAQIRKGVKYPKLPPAKHDHELAKVLPEDEVPYSRWRCDSCSKAPKDRYRCAECPTLDMCGECHADSSKEATKAEKTPMMAILDLADKGAFYHPEADQSEVTDENVEAFLTSFKEGKLTRKQWE